MNILTVAGWMHPDAEGGSFRVVTEVARRLAARGHRVHVLTQRLRPEHPERETLDGVEVHRYRTTAGSGPRFYASTWRAVRREVACLAAEVRFDVLHTHHPVSAFAALHRSPGRRLPCVAIVHSLYFLEYADRHTAGSGRPRLGPLRRVTAGFLRRLDRWNLRRSDRIAVLSRFTQSLIAEHVPECAGKVACFPGGVDLEEFRAEPSRAEARARLGLSGLGLPEGSPLLFTCRRLEHRMGLVELVEAVRRLHQRGRPVVLGIAGRGALAEALEQQVRAAGLAQSVRLLGYVPEDALPLHYRAADAFVLPTRALEGFGLVTAEALACGTPVVGTPVGATPEILRPLDPRLLADDASPEGLCQGILRVLDLLAEEPGLPQRCRAYAEEHLSWDRLVDGVLRLSEELLAQEGAP